MIKSQLFCKLLFKYWAGIKMKIRELLRRSPWLFYLVCRIKFLLSPERIIRKWVNQTRYSAHRKNTTVIAAPDYLGYKGGIYNPGSVVGEEGSTLLLAKAQTCHWWDAVGIYAGEYYSGDPVMFMLDHELNVASSRAVRMDDSYQSDRLVGFEDFRLFRYKDEIWSNHGMISIVKKNSCASTYNAATPCLSRFDPDNASISLIGHPQLDFATRAIEKNWMFFESRGQLYLLYSFTPYRLLKLVDQSNLAFETVIQQGLPEPFRDVGGFGTMMSLSTNPIVYNDESLLMLVHQIERRGIERFYHHWAVLLDKATLLPSKITRQPLFSGVGARGRRAGIVYVSSVIRSDNAFVFYMGEGDAYVTHATLPREFIDTLWIEVSPH